MTNPTERLGGDELMKVAGALAQGASAMSGLQRVATYLDDRIAALRPGVGLAPSSQLELLMAEVYTIRAVVKAEMKTVTGNGGGR